MSRVGLYDDARYPGRCIVALIDHYDHIDEVPAETAAAFIRDGQLVARVQRDTMGARRTNLAILGNRVPHVHAHVVPRGGPGELDESRTIWERRDPATPLAIDARAEVVQRLTRALAGTR